MVCSLFDDRVFLFISELQKMGTLVSNTHYDYTNNSLSLVLFSTVVGCPSRIHSCKVRTYFLCLHTPGAGHSERFGDKNLVIRLFSPLSMHVYIARGSCVWSCNSWSPDAPTWSRSPSGPGAQETCPTHHPSSTATAGAVQVVG